MPSSMRTSPNSRRIVSRTLFEGGSGGAAGLRLGPRRRGCGLRGGREQPAKVERAVRGALDLDARPPEARLHGDGAGRPVEVDADELHALDVDRGARGSGLPDLDVLRPAVALGLGDELAVAERDAVPAVAEVAAGQPGGDRDVRLVRLDRRVPDRHGQLGVEREHRHRPLDRPGVPPPGSPADSVSAIGALTGHVKLSACARSFVSTSRAGGLTCSSTRGERARRQRESLDADLLEAAGKTLDHREEGPPARRRRRRGRGRGPGPAGMAGPPGGRRLGREEVDQIDDAARVTPGREVQPLEVHAGRASGGGRSDPPP